jgi:hypothetical protein
MDIINTTNKGKMLKTLEKFYIYKETSINNQLNDKCTVKPNVIFDTLTQTDTVRSQSTPTEPVSSLYISVTSNTHAITHAGTNSSLIPITVKYPRPLRISPITIHNVTIH